MKQRFLPFTVALCAALAATILSGCREDAIIKSSLTPAVDNVHTFGIGPDFNNGSDTITILSRTEYEDSVITSTRDNFPIYHALGRLKDDFAGTATGSVYMQVVPTATGFKFPTNAVIDDLVLVLPYAGFTWGDTSAITTREVNVYQIKDTFTKEAVNYEFSRRNTAATIIGTATVQTGPKNSGSIQDSVSVLGVKRAPHLRIRLTDPAFKADFLDALAADTSFKSFTDRFNGFYIAPADTATSGTALPYFRLDGGTELYSSAALVAYGHTSGLTDTLIFQFPYDERYAGHFNRITRNYAGAGIATLLDTSVVHDKLVMQGGPGAIIDLRLPFIQHLPKNVIINKAELVFTRAVDPTGTEQKFFGPPRLYPKGMNASGGRYDIADFYPVSSATVDFVDGTPRQVVRGGVTLTQYRINIPREIQKAMVQGSNGLHLRIGGTINYPAAYRVILGGRGMTDPAYRPAINIIYSKQ